MWNLNVRRVVAGTGAVVAAILVVLFAPTVIGGWAPVLHWTCQSEETVGLLPNYYVPAALVNSPYGGEAWGNGTLVAGSPLAAGRTPPGVAAVAFGTGADQGEALSAFYTLNVSIERLGNTTDWGPGTNTRCVGPFTVGFAAPSLYALAGSTILGPNNTTDLDEPHSINLFQGTLNPEESLTFNNSFWWPNSQPIDTCAGSSQWLPIVTARHLNVWFTAAVGGTNYTIPFVLNFQQTFHYMFPANLGTWQVDNLSAPGGPGGGWAFSYAPCS